MWSQQSLVAKRTQSLCLIVAECTLGVQGLADNLDIQTPAVSHQMKMDTLFSQCQERWSNFKTTGLSQPLVATFTLWL
jgi:hypothetical protein